VVWTEFDEIYGVSVFLYDGVSTTLIYPGCGYNPQINDNRYVVLSGGDEVHHEIFLAVPPLCGCLLTPDATVIPRGGTLGFDIRAMNNTDEGQVFGFATYVTKPDGEKYPPSGYLIGPARVSLNPYGSRSAHRSLPIPDNTPLGTYTYYGVVGIPGAGLYDKCQFEFDVYEP
jgi:hypothetical protein